MNVLTAFHENVHPLLHFGNQQRIIQCNCQMIGSPVLRPLHYCLVYSSYSYITSYRLGMCTTSFSLAQRFCVNADFFCILG